LPNKKGYEGKRDKKHHKTHRQVTIAILVLSQMVVHLMLCHLLPFFRLPEIGDLIILEECNQ